MAKQRRQKAPAALMRRLAPSLAPPPLPYVWCGGSFQCACLTASSPLSDDGRRCEGC